MIKGIAFDLEGTIVNVEPAHHWGWILAAAEIGVELKNPEEAIAKCPNFIGGPDKPIIEQIYQLLPGKPQPSEEEAADFLKKKWRHYESLIETIDLSPRKGFFGVLRRLRAWRLPITIGTSVDLERGLLLLKRSELDRHFRLHNIVLPTDVRHSKPAPDCFLETARRMGIKSEEQLVFEDSPRGVKAGIAAGSTVIGMPVYWNDIACNQLREAGAHTLFPEWHDDALLMYIGNLLDS